jgi:transposase InsO family protein
MCPIRPDALWACDFQFDVTADGRTIKLLNIIDEFTREALAIEVDRSIDADKVVAVLDRIAIERWRIDYNCSRPHTAHGDLAPTEFATAWISNQPKAA